MTYVEYLKSIKACSEAIENAQGKTAQQVWETCERGDWMLWLIKKTMPLDDEMALRKLTLAKARCAKLVVHLMKDERSRKAVEVAEQFGLGKATRKELDAAYAATDAVVAATYAAAYAAYAAYAATDAVVAATYAATDAATDAVVAAAYAAAYAAAAAAAAYAVTDAAAAAAYAATDAATDAARKNILKQSAEIVRSIYPISPAHRL